MSTTSLSKLISTRKEELARLLEWRGTNFPVVERQNDLRISFIELELEDLEKLNNQPQINENQQIVLDWVKEYMLDNSDFYNTIYASKQLYSYGVPFGEESKAFTKLNNRELAQVLELFSKWAQEQGEE
ncbi:hypothetical protein ABE893_11200 [Enterococcus entomosocium]|uniref:hypothetical protein n=1 Tax=Enterococcus entomosocium TaxID=3034352 RepID=UPI003D6C0042